jgi:hypothetical protein
MALSSGLAGLEFSRVLQIVDARLSYPTDLMALTMVVG